MDIEGFIIPLNVSEFSIIKRGFFCFCFCFKYSNQGPDLKF